MVQEWNPKEVCHLAEALGQDEVFLAGRDVP
jgi:hypothetical protein